MSLEREIKDLDAEIRLRKAEARKLSDLESKVHVKELEKQRDDKRRHLFEAQGQIEGKKDGLLEGEVDLLPNHRYLIQIESQQQEKQEQKKNVLQRLSARAMDLGVSDLASQHDHYLYGTEKQ